MRPLSGSGLAVFGSDVLRLPALLSVALALLSDPDVPTLPPHITFDEARKFTESMIKGEPHLGHMIKQTFKEAIEGFLPHKK